MSISSPNIERSVADDRFDRDGLPAGHDAVPESSFLSSSVKSGAEIEPGLSRSELVEFLKELLQNGKVEEFNRLRLPEAIDLTGIDLTGRVLDGVDFRDCDLTRAILKGTSLSGAMLQHANLNHADLRFAILDGASFFEIQGEHLDLSGTRSAVRADFRRALLSDCNLTDGIFDGAVFDGANIASASLAGASFSHASLAEFEGERTNLTGSLLSEASFFHANLSGAILFHANGWNVNFEQSNLVGAVAKHATFLSSNEERADKSIIRTSFDGAWVKDLVHDGFNSKENLLLKARPNELPPEGEFEKAPDPDKGFQLVHGIPGSNAKVFYGALNDLDQLIGLGDIKSLIERQVDVLVASLARKQRGLAELDLGMNFIFTGDPGTGKTTVARIISQINHGLGMLKKGHLIETDKSGLVAGYLGQTPGEVKKRLNEAMDGTLFADEIYQLQDDAYSKDAISVLLKGMEDSRDRLSVIFAGYAKEMESFIRQNSGLASRVNLIVHFPSYSNGELVEITKSLLNKKHFGWDSELLAATSAFFTMLQEQRRVENLSWANAREARESLVNQTTAFWAGRIRRENLVDDYEALSRIGTADLPFKLFFGVEAKDIPYKELEWVLNEPDGTERRLKWNELPLEQRKNNFPELSSESVDRLRTELQDLRERKLATQGFELTPQVIRETEELAAERFPGLSERALKRIAHVMLEEKARELGAMIP